MIQLQNVTKTFTTPTGLVHAVRNVSLQVAEGETLCLIGTSGSGKTTTMRMLNRLEEPTAGTVLIDGANVRDLDVIELRRSIGYVIQRGGLFPHMTVERNIGLLCELTRSAAGKIRARVEELLDLVNLPYQEYGKRFPHELSGGQQQRVSVARSLALDPRIILMDEPFGALDPITRTQLHREFIALKERVKKTIVIVTHDMAEAFVLADQVGVMHDGQLVQLDTPAALRAHPATAFVEKFLGTLPVEAQEQAHA